MSYAEQEIFQQYDALRQTLCAVDEQAGRLAAFYRESGCKKLLFIGCGSSYSLAKSAAAAARLRLPAPSYALAAGDLLMNFSRYRSLLEGSLLISISRSGSTSEVLLLCRRAKEELGVPTLSICACRDSALADTASYNLELPWAFDQSVCQTRCVTNLYLACMKLVAVLSADRDLAASLLSAVELGEDYMERYAPVLREIAQGGWSNVVVLADGELEGIAEEGALAFTEISLLPSRYFHVLDVRHGPIVLVDSSTLVVAALSPGEETHQDKLLADLKAKGATLVVFSDRKQASPQADCTILVPPRKSFAAQGVPFIFIAQALSLYRALAKGVNPDAPTGLDPWIAL